MSLRQQGRFLGRFGVIVGKETRENEIIKLKGGYKVDDVMVNCCNEVCSREVLTVFIFITFITLQLSFYYHAERSGTFLPSPFNIFKNPIKQQIIQNLSPIFESLTDLYFILLIQGEVVDLYVPRKCSATNRLITAKDHASVQINVAEVDDEGKMTGSNVTYAFHGGVRETGDSDDSLNRQVFLCGNFIC